jgi:hypothetical protein
LLTCSFINALDRTEKYGEMIAHAGAVIYSGGATRISTASQARA